VCGNPGGGKTVSVDAVLKNVVLSKCHDKVVPKTALDTLGFRVIKLLGVDYSNSSDVYAAIAQQIGLLTTKTSSVDVKQLVMDYFRRQPHQVDFDSKEVPSPLSSDQVGQRKRRRGEDEKVPMTVLVMDEMDLCVRDAIKNLFMLATIEPISPDNSPNYSKGSTKSEEESERRNYSSLIFIGIGNEINYPTVLNLPHHALPSMQIVFSVYNNDTMLEIIHHHTANLLDGVSAALLISRILQYKNGK